MRNFTSLMKMGAKRSKRLSVVLAFSALVMLTTSCVALNLIEIDIIEIQVDSSGNLFGNRITFRATFDNADAYIWDFGDGAAGSGQVVVHTYNSDGTFTVTLEVLINGQSFSSSTVIQVELLEVGQGSLFVSTPSDGIGNGTVISSPAGIVCAIVDDDQVNGPCVANFTLNSIVTLTATPAADSIFVSWTGCDNPSGPICIETIDSGGIEIVEVDFTEVITLTVEVVNPGDRVFSDVGGIDCPGTCSAIFADGTIVTLTLETNASTPYWEGAFGLPCVTNNPSHEEFNTNPIVITMDRIRYCRVEPIF